MFNNPLFSITGLLILFGALIMGIAIWKALILPKAFQAKQSENLWKTLIYFMCFFILGYTLAATALAFGRSDLLSNLTGVVFFFGAIFVLTTVLFTRWTLLDIIANLDKANKELEFTLEELKNTQRMKSHTEKLAAIGELAAGVGHEINNPLSIVVGNLNRVKKLVNKFLGINQYKESISIDERESIYTSFNTAIDRQEDAIERIRVIVNGLRTYARMDTDHLNALDLHEVITNTIQLVNGIYRIEGININVELEAKDYVSYGHIGKFQQIIMNFLTNAKDALDSLENKEICIKTNSEDGLFYLYFRDNGMGMEASVKERIFESFFTTKPVGKGTGMGLGITAKIIHEMKGTVGVDSQLNEGTLFTVTLPLLLQEHLPEDKHQASQINFEKLDGSVLIVDDETDIREILREILEGFGLTVDEASDGIYALDMIKKKNYDYVCTDLKMPILSGEKLLKEVYKIKNRTTKYFIITAGITTNYPESERKLLRNLADAYILKPFTEESIYAVISKHATVPIEYKAAN